jgi:glyoxylase-like metal-dependent hydrolase (beta-lactamase superfamily II)
MRVAQSIHRIGSNDIVNAWLVAEGSELTIIDAGYPGMFDLIPGELAAMGRSWHDVRAVILTHGHGDHIGFAERARRDREIPSSIHEADAALARGEIPDPARGDGRRRWAAWLAFLWFGVRNGSLRVPPLTRVSTFGDGATLDVPGAPRVVLVPGHTPGSAALHVPALGALFTGDALVTRVVTTGRRGPQVSPSNADRSMALASLGRLIGLDPALVLPGHGAPWSGGVARAVELARAAE